MGAPRHGKNALVFINGSELTGANAWAIDIQQDTVETSEFGGDWKEHVVGMRGWSGSVSAMDHEDDKILQTAASYGDSLALLIYPLDSETSDYYSGNATFGMGTSGGVTQAVTNSGSFVGNGALAINGFSA